MNFRIGIALVCWHVLGTPACARASDVLVSHPTRLDWELAAAGFRGDAASDVPADYNSKKQKYQLSVPAWYTTTKAWPLVVFISPAPTPIGWTAFQAVCEKEGILFCSPYNAGNRTPAGLRTRIVLDVVDDVRRNYRIDPNQTYIGGFSGGGRMSCSIGFAFPEVFAGVIPVCGTNPLSTFPCLRHRMVDRMSVAFVTGQGDFNRRETEEWMAPYLKELDVRTQLWVVRGMGHDIPGPGVMDEVMAWLTADLRRRQEDAKNRPRLNLKFDEAFAGTALADRLLSAAREEIQDKQRLWQGVAILLGILKRWPDSDAAAVAKDLIQSVRNDEDRARLLDRQRLDDDRKSLGAQARGYERIGKKDKAIEVWDVLARNYRDAPIAEEARAEVERLQGKDQPFQRGKSTADRPKKGSQKRRAKSPGD